MKLRGVAQVRRNVEKYHKQTHRELADKMQYAISETANWSKQHAPWTDRTGNARNSLYGQTDDTQKNKIVGYHGIGVYYGIYLELSNFGKYRIVQPAQDWLATKLMRILSQ